MLQGMSVQNSSVMNYIIPGLQAGAPHSKLTNILPKTNNNGKGNGYSKEDIVNFLSSLQVTNTTNTAPSTSIVIPGNFTVNNLPGAVGSLTGPNVSTLPFNPYILSNNILTNSNNMLTNSQQDTLFLGSSAPMINPLPRTNTLQAPGLVPGFQTLNMAPPLTNFPSLNMTPNQNAGLGLHQNLAPVFNPGTQSGTIQSGAIFTGNMNQTVSSMAPSQQMSFKVPVLIGNQIILMDVPTQYQAGVSLANTQTTVSLPSFGQSLGLFSSAITPTVDTQPATSCIISTALPCNSLSTNSIQPDVAASSLNIAPHLQPRPGIANIGAQQPRGGTRSLKSPPPLILASSLYSQYQSQDNTKWLTANSDALCSERMASSEISADSKLATVQNMKTQRIEAHTNLSPADANLVLQLQHKDKGNSANNNTEIHLESIVPDSKKYAPTSKFFVNPLTNMTAGTESKRPCMASVILNEYSLDNKELSCTTSKVNEISADLKSNIKENTKNVRSFQMETPDTIKRKMMGKEENKQSLGKRVLELSDNPWTQIRDNPWTQIRDKPWEKVINNAGTKIISDNAGTEKQCTTVKDIMERKLSDSAKNKTSSSISQRTGQQPRLLKPRPRGKLLSTKLPLLIPPEKIKESIDKTLKPSSKPADKTTELLPNQTVTDDQNNSTVDDDDKSWLNDDVICKISEVKSIADFLPQTHSLLLNNKECHGLNSAQGTVFVGPLTKEQLDSIIQNPLELEKYVSVPSGHILSSKALAVPSVSSALPVPVMVQSGDAPKKIACASAVHSYKPPSYLESQFVKIHPKPKIYPKPACPPSSSTTTTTTSSTVTSFSQAGVPETSFSSSSVVPKTRINNRTRISNLTAASDENNGGRKRMVSREKSKAKSSLCLGEVCEDEKEASPQKREYKLECNTAKDSQNSDIIKLSFNGDLNLLKDALRKTTVELENLDSKMHISTVSWPRTNRSDSSDTEMSDSGEDDYKPKCRKRHWSENEQTHIVLRRNKEKELVENVHKRMVPLEVVGDLAIRSRISEDKIGHGEESEGRAIRRSNRISAKPRLDYADLERLPFHDSEESDCELYIATLSPYSQSSPSPPLLSPISDEMHNQDLFVDTTPAESVDMEAQDTISTIHSLVQTQVYTHLVLQPPGTTQPVLQPQASTPPVLQPQGAIHPVLQPPNTAHSVAQPPSTTHSVAQPPSTTHSVAQSPSTTHSVAQSPSTTHSVAQSPSTTHSVPQSPSTTHSVAQPPSTTHSVPQSPSTTHSVAQPPSTTHSVAQPPSNIHSVPQSPSTSHSVPQSPSTSHSVPQSPSTTHSAPQPPSTIHSAPQPPSTIHSVAQPQATSHSVSKVQADTDIGGIDSLSKANDSGDCYYSSESESDMYDSCDKSLSEAGRKKIMWKRHSELTLFLVKHAGRFHSDDEKGEHYCNICLRYKTNGIFRLSHHLKKHLGGALRCSQCEFEACHEVNLGEHRKTRHAL